MNHHVTVSLHNGPVACGMEEQLCGSHLHHKPLLEARANSSFTICSVDVLSWKTVFTVHFYLHMDQIPCHGPLLMHNWGISCREGFGPWNPAEVIVCLTVQLRLGLRNIRLMISAGSSVEQNSSTSSSPWTSLTNESKFGGRERSSFWQPSQLEGSPASCRKRMQFRPNANNP